MSRASMSCFNEQRKTWMAGTSPAMTNMLSSEIPFREIAMNAAQPLAHIQGPIILAGAGKMGGAMLSGWLAQGLDPRSLGVIEPFPADEIGALVETGVRLNPR